MRATQEYYEYQDWYKSQGVTPDADNTDLRFQEETGIRGEDFELYKTVEVEVRGDGARSLPKQLETFDDLFSRFTDSVPRRLKENLKLLKFDCPTPVPGARFKDICGLALEL